MEDSNSISKIISRATQRLINYKTPMSRQNPIANNFLGSTAENYMDSLDNSSYKTSPFSETKVLKHSKNTCITFTQLSHICKIISPFSLTVL